MTEIENLFLGEHLTFSIDIEMAGVSRNPPFSTSIYEAVYYPISEIINSKCAHLPEEYFAPSVFKYHNDFLSY